MLSWHRFIYFIWHVLDFNRPTIFLFLEKKHIDIRCKEAAKIDQFLVVV